MPIIASPRRFVYLNISVPLTYPPSESTHGKFYSTHVHYLFPLSTISHDRGPKTRCTSRGVLYAHNLVREPLL
jgi:hypothetical protein